MQLSMAALSHPLRVVILAHHSLLSGGVASKLSEYKDSLVVRLIDWDRPDLAEMLMEETPDFIIMDMGDANICQKTPIINLLELLPNAHVVRLNLASDSVRVFSSM